MIKVLVLSLILASCTTINNNKHRCFGHRDLYDTSFRIDKDLGSNYAITVMQFPSKSIIGKKMVWGKRSFHKNFDRRVRCRKLQN